MTRSEDSGIFRSHDLLLQKGGLRILAERAGSPWDTSNGGGIKSNNAIIGGSSRRMEAVTLGILGEVNQLVLQEDPDFGDHNQILETIPPRDHHDVPTALAPWMMILDQNHQETEDDRQQLNRRSDNIFFDRLASSSSAPDDHTIIFHPRPLRSQREGGVFVVRENSVLDREDLLFDLRSNNNFSPNDLVELLLGVEQQNHHPKKRGVGGCHAPTNYKNSTGYDNDDCITNHNFGKQGPQESVSKNVTSWYPPCQSSGKNIIINKNGTTVFDHTANSASHDAIIIVNNTSRNKSKERSRSCTCTDEDTSTRISSTNNMTFSNKKQKIHNFINKNTNYSTFFTGDEEHASTDFEPSSIWNEDEEQQMFDIQHHISGATTVPSVCQPPRDATTLFTPQFEGTKNDIATCSTSVTISTDVTSENSQPKVKNYKKMDKFNPNENVFQEDTKEKSCSNKKTFGDRTISNDTLVDPTVAVAPSGTADSVNNTSLSGNIVSSRAGNTTGIAAISATIKDCCQITTPCEEITSVVVNKSALENDPLAAKVENGDTRRCDANQHVTTVSKNPSTTASSSSSSCDKQQHFRDYQCEIWTIRFQELLDYKKEHGDCNVPNTYPQNRHLAQWVKRQRYQYKLKLEGKSSTVTNERKDILEKAGFIWDAHEASWMERWNELKAFREEHGNCHVPTNYSQNQRLAIWAKCQRRQRKLYISGKPSNMNPERLSLLESLGFDWDPRKSRNEQVTKNTTPSP